MFTSVSPVPTTGPGQVGLLERAHGTGWTLESLAWVEGKAALTIPHRWKVTLLLPPWLSTNRVVEVLGTDSRCIRYKGSAQLGRHPAPCPSCPSCFPPPGPIPEPPCEPPWNHSEFSAAASPNACPAWAPGVRIWPGVGRGEACDSWPPFCISGPLAAFLPRNGF